MSQRRSAPTSCGASTRSGTSLMPGSTVNGWPPKYVSTMASSVCCTVGTTLEMATPRISCWVMPRVARMVRMNTPYSSAVCSRRVVRRQDTRSRESWHTPIFVLVLPTSMSRSTVSLRGDFARDDANHRAVVQPDHEGAVGGQIHGQPLASVARMHPAAYAPRALEPGRPERAQASLDEARVALLERVQQGRQDPRHLVRPLGGEPERGRPLPQLSGKHELVDVDADAQDHVGEAARGIAQGLGQDARHLPSVQQHVIGPADLALDAGNLVKSIDDGDGRDEGELGGEGGGNGRTENHRHQEALAGRVEPDAPAPSPARALMGGRDHRALGGAGRGAPGGLGLRGIERGESMDGVTEALRGRLDHARPARLWVSLATICCCSPRRSRSRATTSAGARSTKSGRDSLPSRKAISLRALSISLPRRVRSAVTSTTPCRCTNTSTPGSTTWAERGGRSAPGAIRTRARARPPMRGAAASSALAVAGEGRTVNSSTAAGEIRLSLLSVRKGSTNAWTGAISGSSAASRPLRPAFGKGATMIDSPSWGRRCHISSDMKGMNACSSRSVASSVSISVRWVTARAIGSSV